jgi:IS30 family transposase
LYPDDKSKNIGKDSIYEFIYSEEGEELGLKSYLRCKKGKYRCRRGTKTREKKRNESERKRIDQRPKEAETRERIGGWKCDTIVGSDKSHILTHVDRRSRYTLLDKLEKGLAELTKQTTIARFKSIPKNKKYTIIYDNGTTFTEHEKLEEATKIGIYFAYPYYSWERPTNENTNGLVREFFPKKSSFAKVTTEELEEVAYILNNRPRKCLNYATPAEVFHGKV